MTKYLVTNIQFNQFKGKQTVSDFKMPADINEIKEWINEHYNGLQFTDNEMYAIWIRSVMFYNYETTYDFIKIDDNVQFNKNDRPNLWLADLADLKFENSITATVDISIPDMFIADLTAENLDFANNDIEQAIFENMLDNLYIDIKVKSLTDLILELITNLMTKYEPVAPNLVSELTYELIYDITGSEFHINSGSSATEYVFNENLANKVSDAVFNLASSLVKEAGEYL
jgi:hypothetical protein